MNQIEIGKFITDCRKEKGLTQNELAKELHITDKAISKWENGRGLPDPSIMLDLCKILNISINELLAGKKIKGNEYKKEVEKILLKTRKEIERKDKQLLNLEIIIGFYSVVLFLILLLIGVYCSIPTWQKTVSIIASILFLIIGIGCSIKIEQTAGYYECRKCGYKYKPKYSSVFYSMHIGRTRYIKCPKCHKRSWQKKATK